MDEAFDVIVKKINKSSKILALAGDLVSRNTFSYQRANWKFRWKKLNVEFLILVFP